MSVDPLFEFIVHGRALFGDWWLVDLETDTPADYPSFVTHACTWNIRANERLRGTAIPEGAWAVKISPLFSRSGKAGYLVACLAYMHTMLADELQARRTFHMRYSTTGGGEVGLDYEVHDVCLYSVLAVLPDALQRAFQYERAQERRRRAMRQQLSGRNRCKGKASEATDEEEAARSDASSVS